MSVTIRNTKIRFQLPVSCSGCEVVALSEAREVEVDEVTIADLDCILRKQRVGSSFPVGWASVWGPKKTLYLCPRCKATPAPVAAS